ncbi:Uncharacterised protein [Vibrio cholerae]|nr:Uncharacterised protein [Vibrio cholerae]
MRKPGFISPLMRVTLFPSITVALPQLGRYVDTPKSRHSCFSGK